MMRQGTYPMMPSLPFIPGVEYSGTIEAAGKEVTRVKPGQSVVVLGAGSGYAQYALADAQSVIPIPDKLDKDVAAAFPAVYLTAYHMLNTLTRVKSGQTILLYAAAGGVGTAVIQLARLTGATVIGLTSTEDKIKYVRQQGADHAINYKTDDVARRVKEITNGKGVDLILNSVAGDTLSRDFDLLAPLGQIIWSGLAAGLPPENLVQHFSANFGKGVGLKVFHLLYSIALPYPELMAQSVKQVLGYLMEGKIRPHIHERIPLSEAARAHRLMESGAVMGKLVLKP
jgi:NADPH2:quinone reductase